LYVFARLTEAEKAMASAAKTLVKAMARAVRPVLWPRKSSESQSARVPSENLILLSEKRGKPALEVSAGDRASVGLQMRTLLESLKGRRLTA
jgi:hypothetical protein